MTWVYLISWIKQACNRIWEIQWVAGVGRFDRNLIWVARNMHGL